jgi:hypothetical protein
MEVRCNTPLEAERMKSPDGWTLAKGGLWDGEDLWIQRVGLPV